jgi:hypothetical protein
MEDKSFKANDLTFADYNVKKLMLGFFQDMNNSLAELRTTNNSSWKKQNLLSFRNNYAKFYMQIRHDNKLKKLTSNEKRYLEKAYNNLDKINQKECLIILNLCRKFLEEIGIFKIEFRTDNPHHSLRTTY